MNTLTEKEIIKLETKLSLKFPNIFKILLLQIGYGYKDQYIEIYNPEKIEELYKYHFEEKDDIFKKYFPFGCNNKKQQIWLVNVNLNKVASIYHDTHPDDYDEEEWLSESAWVQQEKIKLEV